MKGKCSCSKTVFTAYNIIRIHEGLYNKATKIKFCLYIVLKNKYPIKSNSKDDEDKNEKQEWRHRNIVDQFFYAKEKFLDKKHGVCGG